MFVQAVINIRIEETNDPIPFIAQTMRQHTQRLCIQTMIIAKVINITAIKHGGFFIQSHRRHEPLAIIRQQGMNLARSWEKHRKYALEYS